MGDPFLFKIVLITLVPFSIFCGMLSVVFYKKYRAAIKEVKISRIYEERFIRSLTNSLMDTVPVKERK